MNSNPEAPKKRREEMVISTVEPENRELLHLCFTLAMSGTYCCPQMLKSPCNKAGAFPCCTRKETSPFTSGKNGANQEAGRQGCRGGGAGRRRFMPAQGAASLARCQAAWGCALFLKLSKVSLCPCWDGRSSAQTRGCKKWCCSFVPPSLLRGTGQARGTRAHKQSYGTSFPPPLGLAPTQLPCGQLLLASTRSPALLDRPRLLVWSRQAARLCSIHQLQCSTPELAAAKQQAK